MEHHYAANEKRFAKLKIFHVRVQVLGTRDYIVSREIAKMDQLQEEDFPDEEETLKQVSNLLYKLRTYVAMAISDNL